MNEKDQAALIEMLIKDNEALRKYGLQLSEAATRVIETYDGVHRLSLAVSNFMRAIGNEGNRDNLYLQRRERE